MIIDISRALYAIDKSDNKRYKVTSLFFPLGKPSGKDLTIDCGGVDEWRSIDEVELIQDE